MDGLEDESSDQNGLAVEVKPLAELPTTVQQSIARVFENHLANPRGFYKARALLHFTNGRSKELLFDADPVHFFPSELEESAAEKGLIEQLMNLTLQETESVTQIDFFFVAPGENEGLWVAPVEDYVDFEDRIAIDQIHSEEENERLRHLHDRIQSLMPWADFLQGFKFILALNFRVDVPITFYVTHPADYEHHLNSRISRPAGIFGSTTIYSLP
jgi:hypothetical protein